jgi:hypothetical protein
MWSIDNTYLFTALTFGLYALCVQVALFVWPPIRLAVFSLSLPHSDPKALAAFSMIGIYVLNVIMGGTAAGGGVQWSFLLIIAGWTTVLVKPAAQFGRLSSRIGFRRVMA